MLRALIPVYMYISALCSPFIVHIDIRKLLALFSGWSQHSVAVWTATVVWWTIADLPIYSREGSAPQRGRGMRRYSMLYAFIYMYVYRICMIVEFIFQEKDLESFKDFVSRKRPDAIALAAESRCINM